jgi:hypothetical protein
MPAVTGNEVKGVILDIGMCPGQTEMAGEWHELHVISHVNLGIQILIDE